jgi:anti-sigma B factor antagonist
VPIEPLDQEVFADGPLFISRHRYGRDVLVVTLAGELDAANVGSAHRVIHEVAVEEPEEILVVDLSPLEFIDSSGIALLVSLADFGGDGGGLRIVPGEAPAVARVLKLTGVDTMVQMAREHPARAA